MRLLPILFISCFFSLGRAKDCGGNNVTQTIIVGKYGHDAFRTIQAAIDSVRSNNDHWVKIHIKAGLYMNRTTYAEVDCKGPGANTSNRVAWMKKLTKDCGGNIVTKTIIVGKDGHAAFSTIQAAIDSVRSNNDQWVKIHIKAGLYIESVVIPINKPCIILEGEGTPKTIISHSDHQSLNNKATLLPFAPNLLASGITFKNSYNVATTKYKSYDEVSKTEPANAARLFGDKYFFHNCSFIGYQDTLYDHSGRHVFKDCYIQGEIDFIYGNGQSYYQNCLINAVGRAPNFPGFVTAQGRNSADETSGFVFEGGSIIGNGKVNLGRPWRPYARVIFKNTYFSDIVTPQGWSAWRPGSDPVLNLGRAFWTSVLLSPGRASTLFAGRASSLLAGRTSTSTSWTNVQFYSSLDERPAWLDERPLLPGLDERPFLLLDERPLVLPLWTSVRSSAFWTSVRSSGTSVLALLMVFLRANFLVQFYTWSGITYVEVDCGGPGADTSNRVSWMKKLNTSEIEQFSLASFINKDGWVDNLPIQSS
ncbi:hypothetical protein LR48_Vigan07g025900 [Vigna angularis]|uniref:pectinesterase n=1 Tax=Phaseolus angularis TaxID=3914 RepID=A0A0L9UUM0_PHAAN|nr:hypothetical protein LR48_Vigan07g025900 [Vigna angularis]